MSHRQSSRPRNVEAFSSSSDSDVIEDGSSGEEEVDEEETESDETDSSGTSQSFNEANSAVDREKNSTKDNQSEWDKALRTGTHSKGQASDFFNTTMTPSHSFDSSDYITMDGASVTGSEIVRRKTEGRPHPPLPPPPPPPPPRPTPAVHSQHNQLNHNTSPTTATPTAIVRQPHRDDANDFSAGVLPDVLMTMRQKIESITLFDSDMMRIANDSHYNDNNDEYDDEDDELLRESRESLKRSSQQSISAAVLVSLAHKRYERRRLAAMEIEKVVRSLVVQNELERVRAILLLLADDYVRSTSEDARKGGVVALAACAIGLKKAKDGDNLVLECRDLILASVVHACQDHSQRVRYYATESLFNVVKVIPSMAVQHFFILFEILRSLYADVDADVRSGAELLDKKLKDVIVNAMNAGVFAAEDCIPVFARFIYMQNKATKRLTLTWLQELNEKLVATPILEFLHLFLGGIFDMVADPAVAIRQSALAFLHSVLPKLLVARTDAIDSGENKPMPVDYDKVLQSLVTTMEHPDPFVRKVAMYWMSRIVKAHMGEPENRSGTLDTYSEPGPIDAETTEEALLPSSAAVSIRNSLPHILPGIFLSIGDDFPSKHSSKDSFLPDQTTRALAEQANSTLQEAVRRNGTSYVPLLDGFIVALREELDSPDGIKSRYPPAVERSLYRVDVRPDGSGIESPGWFSGSNETRHVSEDSMIVSRLCALHWITVLYESVVPSSLKADYAREFVYAIIHQLVDSPPDAIVYKSLEVLARITVPAPGEDFSRSLSSSSLSGLAHPAWLRDISNGDLIPQYPMKETNVAYALDILDPFRRPLISRNREVFAALVQLHAYNEDLLADLSGVITYMCQLQPPEFVFVSFSVELDRFICRRCHDTKNRPKMLSRDLKFVSTFVQHMNHVLLNAPETKDLRDILKDSIRAHAESELGRRSALLFHILLHSFSHNLAATVSLCVWAGAYRTTTMFLNLIDPLDVNLMFYLEIDRFVEMLERPIFRHLHVRMLEIDIDPTAEGSGAMLFRALKSLLMILPQSTCYKILSRRLTSVARYRQGVVGRVNISTTPKLGCKEGNDAFLNRVHAVRVMHCDATWLAIRAESLEVPCVEEEKFNAEGSDRRDWLGYSSEKEHQDALERYRNEKKSRQSISIEEVHDKYHDLTSVTGGERPELLDTVTEPNLSMNGGQEKDESSGWKGYWTNEQ